MKERLWTGSSTISRSSSHFQVQRSQLQDTPPWRTIWKLKVVQQKIVRISLIPIIFLATGMPYRLTRQDVIEFLVSKDYEHDHTSGTVESQWNCDYCFWCWQAQARVLYDKFETLEEANRLFQGRYADIPWSVRSAFEYMTLAQFEILVFFVVSIAITKLFNYAICVCKISLPFKLLDTKPVLCSSIWLLIPLLSMLCCSLCFKVSLPSNLLDTQPSVYQGRLQVHSDLQALGVKAGMIAAVV